MKTFLTIVAAVLVAVALIPAIPVLACFGVSAGFFALSRYYFAAGDRAAKAQAPQHYVAAERFLYQFRDRRKDGIH